MLFMNHLDIGYNGISPQTGFINNVLNQYFTIYFPRAIALAKAMKVLGGPEKFIYTSHLFLLHLYLYCDSFQLSNISLSCPSTSQQQEMMEAIQNGDIYFHAAPDNIEFGNMYSPLMVEVSFLLNQQLSKTLGVPPSKVVSIRDVPGTVRSLIPIFKKMGIEAISVGVNNYSPAPDMPNPGIWIEPTTKTSIFYMQTGQGIGYPNVPGNPSNPGGLGADSCVTYPNFPHALCWSFRTDNNGPPESIDEIYQSYETLRYQFPGADIFASTYENFTAHLPEIEQDLPVTTKESGETWLVSDTADPVKMAYFRTASRVFTECYNAGLCDLGDSRIFFFLRLLLKIPEHTYGLPTIEDHANYTNEMFHVAKQELKTYKDCESSWIEQREIVTRVGFSYLKDHPLAGKINQEILNLVPKYPNLKGYYEVTPDNWNKNFVVNSNTDVVTLGLNSNGAISNLIMKTFTWASNSRVLSKFIYRTFNDTDLKAQNIGYCCCCWGWENMQKVANPKSQKVLPNLIGLYASAPPSASSFSTPFSLLAHLNFSDPDLHSYYGAPSELFLNYTVIDGETIWIELQVFNKTSTRLGEALFLDFENVPQGSNWKWWVDVLDLPVDPLEVVKNGGVHQHGVKEGVIYKTIENNTHGFGHSIEAYFKQPKKTQDVSYFAIDTLDSAVVSPRTENNEETIFLMPLNPLTGTVQGFSVILYQNAFNTNVPLYSIDDSWKWRFRIRAA
uniref:Glycoside hydrolase family 38 N-terminal domain-containing protein n=1 Tax=Arcella intermedia TaxID=1963864 RepID=A0A6B2KYD0_9EUKA